MERKVLHVVLVLAALEWAGLRYAYPPPTSLAGMPLSFAQQRESMRARPRWQDVYQPQPPAPPIAPVATAPPPPYQDLTRDELFLAFRYLHRRERVCR